MKKHCGLLYSLLAITVLLPLCIPPETSAIVGDNFRNKTTKNGLRTGLWVEQYETHEGRWVETGTYAIIPVSTYDFLEFSRALYRIRYKGFEQLLFVEGRSDSLLSVKDGLWYTYDSTRTLRRTDLWSNGLNLWTTYFDEQGEIQRHNYRDFENDTSFYLTYVDKRLFKKAYYPPEDKNNETVLYYPENDLVIEDAEPRFYANFLSKTTDTFQLRVTARKSMDIVSMKTTASDMQLVDASFQAVRFPLHMAAHDTVILNMLFAPVPATYREYDTIVVATSEANVPEYKLYCKARASHLDGWNVQTIQDVTLSKKKDKYLIIAPMGTVTDAYITSATGEEKSYGIYGITRIDLEELDTGRYDMRISSCHTGGYMTLIIVE
jgi:hypothetical protein